MLTTEPLDTTIIVDVLTDLSTPFGYLTNAIPTPTTLTYAAPVGWHGIIRNLLAPSIRATGPVSRTSGLHFYETALHRADVLTHTRVGRRELAGE